MARETRHYVTLPPIVGRMSSRESHLMPEHKVPTHLLESRWRIVRRTTVSQAAVGNIIQVVKLEFDETTGEGVVHISDPGQWTLRISLSSFYRLQEVGAITPI